MPVAMISTSTSPCFGERPAFSKAETASIAVRPAVPIAMQSARAAITRGQLEQTRLRLFAAGLLTAAFLIGQMVAWRQVRLSELFTPQNPAVAFFYVLTAVHGLHLLGGLFVWTRTLARSLRKDIEPIDLRLSVELTTVYWHYLLLVWLGLFAVLLST